MAEDTAFVPAKLPNAPGAGKAFAKLIFYLDYCKQTARLAKSFVLAEACVSRICTQT
jgi:hypothetical protein